MAARVCVARATEPLCVPTLPPGAIVAPEQWCTHSAHTQFLRDFKEFHTGQQQQRTNTRPVYGHIACINPREKHILKHTRARIYPQACLLCCNGTQGAQQINGRSPARDQRAQFTEKIKFSSYTRAITDKNDLLQNHQITRAHSHTHTQYIDSSTGNCYYPTRLRPVCTVLCTVVWCTRPPSKRILAGADVARTRGKPLQTVQKTTAENASSNAWVLEKKNRVRDHTTQMRASRRAIRIGLR